MPGKTGGGSTRSRGRNTSRNSRSAARTRSATQPSDGFSTAEVRVGRLPGRIENIVLNGGRTVNDALEGAGLSVDGNEVRVNGRLAELDAELKEGDTVLLVRKIQGNGE